jgi:hypothetical protein
MSRAGLTLPAGNTRRAKLVAMSNPPILRMGVHTADAVHKAAAEDGEAPRFTLRLGVHLAERAHAVAAELAPSSPKVVSRSAVLREAVARGLEELEEKTAKAKGKAPPAKASGRPPRAK